MADIFDNRTPFDTAWSLCTQFGFSVFPLEARDKFPVLVNRGAGTRLSWKQYQTNRTTEDQLNEFKERYPNCNWAVVCGEVSDLVVVDCDDQDALVWAEKTLIPTPWKVKTSDGWHLYYHYPKGEKIASINLRYQKETAFVQGEIRSDGGYVVAPQSIHPSGAVYTLTTNGAEWDWVPEFGYLEELNKAIEEQKKLNPNIDLSQVEATFGTVEEGGRNTYLAKYCGKLYAAGLTLEQVKERVKKKNDECCVPPLKTREALSVACSIYRTHKRNHPDGTGTTAITNRDIKTELLLTNYDGVRFIDIMAEETKATWPDELLHPGGILEEIMEYTRKAAYVSHPIYDLAGAITILATIVGRKIWTQSHLTTNIYATVIGSSTSGKNSPKKAVEHILYRVSKELIGGTDMASTAALLTQLEEHHRCCFVLDEFGLMLQACKNANSPKAEIFKVLMDLFTRGDGVYVKPYKDPKDKVFISWHNLTVLGMSTHDEFWNAMQNGEATNGFLGRMLPFEHDGTPQEPNEHIDPHIPEALLAKLKRIHRLNCGEFPPDPSKTDGGNEMINVSGVSEIMTPDEKILRDVWKNSEIRTHTVYMTKEAKEFHDEKARGYYYFTRDKITGKNAEAKKTVYGRLHEHALKLSLVKMTSRAGDKILDSSTRIELEDIQWAWLLSETIGKHFVKEMETSLHVTEFEKYCNTAIEAIKKYVITYNSRYKKRQQEKGYNPIPGAPRKIIEEALKIQPRMVAEVIEKLANTNTIKLKPGWKSSPSSKRPLDLFVLVEDQED